ncbi:MAG: hypothetical protein ACYDEY_09595, partial [Acidimicrobiales bacterium]
RRWWCSTSIAEPKTGGTLVMSAKNRHSGSRTGGARCVGWGEGGARRAGVVLADVARAPIAPLDPASGSRTGGALRRAGGGGRGECWDRARRRGFSGVAAPHMVCNPRPCDRFDLKSSNGHRI